MIVGIDGCRGGRSRSAFDFRLATKQIGGTSDLSYVRGGKTGDAMVALEAARPMVPTRWRRSPAIPASRAPASSLVTPPLAQDWTCPMTHVASSSATWHAGSPADRMGLERAT